MSGRFAAFSSYPWTKILGVDPAQRALQSLGRRSACRHQLVLLAPVTHRLRCEAKFAGELIETATGPSQLNDLLPELRRVRTRMFSH
jgi:hypothetical protein